MKRGRNVETRLGAVRSLAQDPSPEAFDLLLQAANDKSGVVSARAVRALGERLGVVDDSRRAEERERATRVLVDRYWALVANDGKRSDPGCLARIEIVRVLGAWEVYHAADLFFHAAETIQVERSGNGLEDVAIPLRAQAAAAIASVRPPGALLAISLLLFDDDPRMDVLPQDRPYRTVAVRKTAAKSLAILGDPGGAAVLGVRLAHRADEVAEVLVECMDALIAIDPNAALKVLTPYLRDRDAYLAASAATALAALSQEYHTTVLERLSEALIDRIDDARSAIALAIASMRCDEAVDTLHQLAAHEDPEIALEAVAALGQRGDGLSKDALRVIAAESDDPMIRMKARETSAKL